MTSSLRHRAQLTTALATDPRSTRASKRVDVAAAGRGGAIRVRQLDVLRAPNVSTGQGKYGPYDRRGGGSDVRPRRKSTGAGAASSLVGGFLATPPSARPVSKLTLFFARSPLQVKFID